MCDLHIHCFISVYHCIFVPSYYTKFLPFWYYTVSQKTLHNCFCQNFVKFPPFSIIFGRKMAKRLKLCKMHSFSTSPNSCHHTTVLKGDVPNRYTMLKLICKMLSVFDLHIHCFISVYDCIFVPSYYTKF